MRPTLVFQNQALAPQAFEQQLLRSAAALQAAGVGPTSVVALLMRNSPAAIELMLAVRHLGAQWCPVNWHFKTDEVQYILDNSGAQVLLADADLLAALPGLDLARVKTWAVRGTTASVPAWEPLRDATAPLFTPAAPPRGAMFYTSGTTGRPKGVPRRHRAERAAAVAQVAQYSYSVGEVTLGVMPMYHTMGVRSLLSMAIVDGTVVCLPRFEPAEALRLVQAEKVTNLFLVPTLYHDLLAHPAFAGTDISSVTTIGFAGAPMNDALLKRLSAAFKPQLFVNHYGSSEIYTFTIDQDAPAKPGSAGRAGFNCRIRVVKLDDGNRRSGPDDGVARGEEGQIIADLSGDEAFEGYWNRPDADAKSLRDGWYFTGDTGTVDADGDLYVTGRVDDMIISGGENISPVDIESVLSLHPDVDEVAVAGLPDERWGQKVVAFIKAKGKVDAGMLDAHCRESALPNYKRPREYVFVQAVPKSPVGKILRRKLVSGEYDKAG